MNITECMPLAGRGLVARRGHLVALSGGTDAGPDPLLTALTAVAYANGDGAALVLAATRAAAERGGRPAWACAGVTSGEQVAVLVHGEAVALVSADGSPEARVTASDPMIPAAGTFYRSGRHGPARHRPPSATGPQALA
jgi:antitoxin (DNA-binding transcriptional repressor) of toxin-antitoxin stability system